MFVNQSLLGSLGQISLHSLGSAGVRGALVETHRVAAVYGAVLGLSTNTSTTSTTSCNISGENCQKYRQPLPPLVLVVVWLEPPE